MGKPRYRLSALTFDDLDFLCKAPSTIPMLYKGRQYVVIRWEVRGTYVKFVLEPLFEGGYTLSCIAKALLKDNDFVLRDIDVHLPSRLVKAANYHNIVRVLYKVRQIIK